MLSNTCLLNHFFFRSRLSRSMVTRLKTFSIVFMNVLHMIADRLQLFQHQFPVTTWSLKDDYTGSWSKVAGTQTGGRKGDFYIPHKLRLRGYHRYDKCKLVKSVNNAHCLNLLKQRFCIANRQLRNIKKNPLIYIHLEYNETELSWIQVIKDQFSLMSSN